LPTAPSTLLEPRKTPVQARSAASVDAMLQAAIQVLLAVGKDRLTTTRVAHRAGVSVGTLYQYFPNKTALLRAALTRHLNVITGAIEQACLAQHGKTLRQMSEALINTYLEVKIKDIKTSVALNSVIADIDGAKIYQQKTLRSHKAIVAMLTSSCDPLHRDPKLVASMLQATLLGVSRTLLDAPHPEKLYDTLRHELIFVATAYLSACSA
jgi:AcrR family transcriptional regulator